MSMFELIAVLICLAAVFSYANARWLKLPSTIALMAMSMGLSLALFAVGTITPGWIESIRGVVESVEFDKTLLNGMLGFLLFAGALHVDLEDLGKQKLVVGLLASVGTLSGTFMIGGAVYYLMPLFGLELPWIACLLFGALISPTDPIAVLGILKRLGAPKSLELQITGESLFNDGIAVVVFLVIFSLAGLDPHHAEMTAGGIATLFIQEAVGGAVFGLVVGFVAYRMFRSVDDYRVEVLGSLALVAGGYALAMKLHLSGPIAMVIAGLLIGNHGRAMAMSSRTRERLDDFWELIDEALNAVLFVLIGLELLVVSFSGASAMAGLAAIGLTLVARFVAVGLPVKALRAAGLRDRFVPHAVKLMTWGGLRGGISVALCLSIPAAVGGQEVLYRNPLLAMTYIVVAFSILVQGLSVGPLLAHYGLSGQPRGSAHD